MFTSFSELKKKGYKNIADNVNNDYPRPWDFRCFFLLCIVTYCLICTYCVYIMLMFMRKNEAIFIREGSYLDFIFSSIVLNTYSNRLPLICLPSSCTGLPGSALRCCSRQAPCSGRGAFHGPGRNARQPTTALSWSERGSSDLAK